MITAISALKKAGVMPAFFVPRINPDIEGVSAGKWNPGFICALFFSSKALFGYSSSKNKAHLLPGFHFQLMASNTRLF